MYFAATLLAISFVFAVKVYLSLPAPTPPKISEGQVLELAHQRAIGFGLTEDKVVKQPSLGEDARVEYSTVCYFYSPASLNHTGVIVCDEHTTIIYDGGKGVIMLNPQALKIVPELLQSMPPGTDLYITVVEEAAKIDQVIFLVDQGRLHPEAASK